MRAQEVKILEIIIENSQVSPLLKMAVSNPTAEKMEQVLREYEQLNYKILSCFIEERMVDIVELKIRSIKLKFSTLLNSLLAAGLFYSNL